MRSLIGGLIFWLVVAAIAAATFVYSGLYNVSARVAHWDAVATLLDVTRERSIEAHSDEVDVPADLADPEWIRKGVLHFHETCSVCHGAPGQERKEFALGLYPLPPDFGREATEVDSSPKELFWIVTNGLKFTGMPSFGETHSREEIWHIVAALRAVRGMSPAEYRQLVEEAEGHGDGHHHDGAREQEHGSEEATDRGHAASAGK